MDVAPSHWACGLPTRPPSSHCRVQVGYPGELSVGSSACVAASSLNFLQSTEERGRQAGLRGTQLPRARV